MKKPIFSTNKDFTRNVRVSNAYYKDTVLHAVFEYKGSRYKMVNGVGLFIKKYGTKELVYLDRYESSLTKHIIKTVLGYV